MSNDLLVYARDKETAFELLALARELAAALQGKVVYAALGEQVTNAAEFGSRGADRVLTSNDPFLQGFQVEPYADAFEQLVKLVQPKAFLVGSTIRSKDAAARVAARLEVAVGSEFTNLQWQEGRLVGDRFYYSGNSVLTELLTKEPFIALVPARAYEVRPPDANRKIPIEPVSLSLKPSKAKLAKEEKKPSGGVHLEDADIIVSVGRGVKKKEDLAMVNELAQAMGAQVGCTRPIAADLKWLGDENWIGLSGHEVKPKAYIGVGVSGQIQHVAGMRGSKLIVAINKDEEAPLVKISDYAIVDDLYKIVPAFTREVQKLKGKG